MWHHQPTPISTSHLLPPCPTLFIHHWNTLIRTLPLVPAQCECVFIHHWNKDTSLIRTLPLVPAQCECVFIHHWNKDTSLIRTLPLVPAQCECVFIHSWNKGTSLVSAKWYGLRTPHNDVCVYMHNTLMQQQLSQANSSSDHPEEHQGLLHSSR